MSDLIAVPVGWLADLWSWATDHWQVILAAYFFFVVERTSRNAELARRNSEKVISYLESLRNDS